MGICMSWWRRVGDIAVRNVVVIFGGGEEDYKEHENKATVR